VPDKLGITGLKRKILMILICGSNSGVLVVLTASASACSDVTHVRVLLSLLQAAI
jgi:hypothetical protein